MTEQIRHIAVILLGVIVAIVAAVVHVCDHELYMIASAIIAGEFGLARTGGQAGAVKVDHPVTINQGTNGQ
jgi:hypothetical protein